MLTIDQLYEAYMDMGAYAPGEGQAGTPFAQDVWEFFGGADTGWAAEEWATDWGMYLPAYDPTQVELAARERDLDYQRAADILDISNRVAGRVYATETDILGTQLGAELEKSRQVAGGLGLRSGTLEAAVEDTRAATSNRVEDLGDRLMLNKERDENTYDAAMVDAALDFDKSEHQSKKELYDRTLAAIGKLTQLGAFAEKECEDHGQVTCSDGSCASSFDNCSVDACGTPNGTITDPLECTGVPSGNVVGNTITGECNFGECDFTAGCQQVCVSAGADLYGGGMLSCTEDCTGAMAGGAGTWGAGEWVIDYTTQFEEEETIIDECYNELGEWICGEETGGACVYPCSITNGVCRHMWTGELC
jgi:hypothetical protein